MAQRKTIKERIEGRNGRAHVYGDGDAADTPLDPRLAKPDPAPAPSSSPPWPARPEDAAYYGLAGEIVRMIAPHSEADPVALLGQILVAFGNMIGRKAHFVAEDDCHYTNLYLALVGKTAKGRKGSSWGRVRKILDIVDQQWIADCVQGGLSSGEGIIWHVRDRIVKVTDGEPIEIDPGVTDKRLLAYEGEFASVLKNIERQGNTLSPILRNAWDTGRLQSLVKHNSTKATGAHVSIIGHCTVDELRRYLSATEVANGFANRFLWLCVQRSKVLPEGGSLEPAALQAMSEDLTKAAIFARDVEFIRRDDKARKLWGHCYKDLSDGKPGLSGAILARGEAQVMRLACLYALLDRSHLVDVQHLQAALALWQYCERSVRYIFGDSLGDPLADEILRELRQRAEGMTRTDIRDFTGRNQSGSRIHRALAVLMEHGFAYFVKEETEGRSCERWFAGKGTTT